MRDGERFNVTTHLLGLVLALTGAGFLLAKTLPLGRAAEISAALIFALSTVGLYATSTLYHGSHGAVKLRWQRADHCMIYLLIAGSYTPFALVTLSDGWDIALLAAIWAFASAGIWREASSTAPPKAELWIYLGLGWICILGATLLSARLEHEVLTWLLAGAACYTIGTVFYVNRLGLRHAHGTWHLFVLAGTTSHYIAVSAVVG